ncbi:MAG: DUF169 domain-containing protein [Halodesulfurarchaeum sp.]
MTDTETYRSWGNELEQRLRLRSHPLAIRLLEDESEVPDEAIRPSVDEDHRLSLCQAFERSRREGETIAMLGGDMWCFEPVVGYGLEEPPGSFLDGDNRYPKDVATREAGRRFAEEFPKLDAGKFVGILSAPLGSTPFRPHVVTTYLDSEQLSLLMMGREYRLGGNLTCSLSAHAACVYGIVPALQEKRCQVAVPCRGDRYSAMANPDEMIATVPTQELGDIDGLTISDVIEGLREVEKTGTKLPSGRKTQAAYPLPESYERIASEMEYFESSP